MTDVKNIIAVADKINIIKDLLKCQLCKNYLFPPIKIHKNDFRIICGKCIDKFEKNDLKEEEYISKIGELLEFPCSLKKYGCREECTWKEAKIHEDSCPFRRYKCPCSTPCIWEGSPKDLRTHFDNNHINFPADKTIKVNFTAGSVNYLVEEHGELFVFQIKCDTTSDFLWYDVRFIGSPLRAPRFHFKVELFIEDEDRKYIERKQVEPDNKWELNEAEALCIRIGMVKAMLMNSNNISLKLQISVREPLYNGQTDQALMHEVECPVCKDHMIRPIRMCESGHNICDNCFHKLTVCPTCREKFNNTRNISLETLSEQMHYRCMYYDEGCNFTDVPQNIKDHEMVCEVSYYDCPLKQLVNCKWKGRVGHVCIHASKEHQFKF